MTIEKTSSHKERRNIRRWAERHKQEIYERGSNQCIECKTNNKLTIHHKQYIIGFEFVELRCQRCHRNWHNKEIRKRLLTFLLNEAKKSKRINLKDFEKDLQQEIDSIPVELLRGVKIDGL